MKLPGGGMSWKYFGKTLKDEVSRDKVMDLAGSVTYYGILALFPFILFLVALASVIITPQQAEQLVQQLSEVAPAAVTDLVGGRIRQLGQDQNVGLLGFGALAAVWAASGATRAVMRAFNETYGVEEERPFWKVYGISLLMTIVASVLALAAALVAIAAKPLGDAVGGPIGTAITWLRLPVAGVVVMFLWSLLYYYLPDTEQKFKFITPGSVGGVILWVLASWGFSLYVANFGSYDATYGSIAGVIVLLLWMYISSAVLLVGAETNAIIEHRSKHGKRAGAKSKADVGESGTEDKAARRAERDERHAGDGDRRAGAGRGGRAGGPPRVDRWSPTAAPISLREARPAPRSRGHLRGLTAIVAGFAAGVLVGRREA